MATGRNFSMSGINSGHHNLPTYEMSLKSDNVEFLRYCGDHFENGDRQKFFNVGTSLSTHISNFDFNEPCHGEVYSIQHYVIKFVSYLRKVGGFLQVLQFPPPIKLTATI
jgi:hypothetical protein